MRDDETGLGNPGEGKARKPFLLFGFLFRRMPLIALVGGGLTALFLVLLLPFVKTTYSTDGQLLIDLTKQVTVAGREEPFPGLIKDYMRTMVQRINTIDVVSEAVKRLKPPEYPDFLKPMDPPEVNAARLMGRLSVREVPGTYLVSLGITASKPEGLGPALNRVMQVFVEKNQQEKRQLVQRRINYLTHERDKILARLEEARGNWLQPREGLQDDLFLDPKYTAHITKLDTLQKQHLESENRRDEENNRYQTALANRDKMLKMSLQPLANERIFDNTGINHMSMWTYEQSASLRKSIDGLTQENEDRRNIEERIRAMDDYLVAYKERTAALINTQLKDKQKYELEIEVLRAKNAFDAAAAHAEQLRGMHKSALTEYNQVARALFDVSNIQLSTEQLQNRLNTLNTRIDDAEVEAMAPVQIFIDKTARTPTAPEGSNFNLLALVSLALGFGGVFSFVLAFDILDNRLRDNAEVHSALGGMGTEPIPLMEGRDHPPGSFVDATLDWPRHPAALAIRALAVRLELEREKHGARVFALAGLGQGCGVSSLALSLAHVLKTHDRRILVLECNLVRPGLAAVHGGLEAAPGLWALLARETADIAGVTQRDPRRQVDVITAGGDRIGIPDRAALGQLIDALRGTYDMVLLDVGDLLRDEFSFYAAAHSDAVLLVGREDVSLYRNLRRAIDVLVAARLPAISAVLNFVRDKRAERVRTSLHSEMRWLSRKHWVLHGMARRVLRRFSGKSRASPSDNAGEPGQGALARLLGRLPRRPSSGGAAGGANGDSVPAPLPLVDGEIALPQAAQEPGTPCKWVFDRKRKVLINVTRKVKYPEGTYIYRAFGEENGFEILGGAGAWVPGHDVTHINLNP